MNEKTLNQYVREVIRQCTGMAGDTVRPANQDAPAKGDPFATVLISLHGRVGRNDVTWEDVPNDPNNQVTENSNTQQMATASIQFFRTGARDLAEKFRARVEMADIAELMRSYGIGFVDTTPIRNLSTVINSAWEDRAQLDMEFYYVHTESVNHATYGTFPINVHTPAAPVQSFEVIKP